MPGLDQTSHDNDMRIIHREIARRYASTAPGTSNTALERLGREYMTLIDHSGHHDPFTGDVLILPSIIHGSRGRIGSNFVSLSHSDGWSINH